MTTGVVYVDRAQTEQRLNLIHDRGLGSSPLQVGWSDTGNFHRFARATNVKHQVTMSLSENEVVTLPPLPCMAVTSAASRVTLMKITNSFEALTRCIKLESLQSHAGVAYGQEVEPFQLLVTWENTVSPPPPGVVRCLQVCVAALMEMMVDLLKTHQAEFLKPSRIAVSRTLGW